MFWDMKMGLPAKIFDFFLVSRYISWDWCGFL
jgi:hypothetical protein